MFLPLGTEDLDSVDREFCFIYPALKALRKYYIKFALLI